MSLVLYSNPASSNAMKVRFLLAELGLEYEREHVPLARPRPDWYVEIYPFGTIPFLRDGDFELGESNAILRYLADREGRADLYPREPRERNRLDPLVWKPRTACGSASAAGRSSSASGRGSRPWSCLRSP